VSQTPGIDDDEVPDSPGVSHGSWLVSTVSETGSTNDDLLRAAAKGGLVDRSVLRTDHQTSGRGRLDRRWDAPPGSNLLASVFFASPGAHPGEMLQRVGVAVVRALGRERAVGEHVLGERRLGEYGQEPKALGLKWPNDVLFDGRKLAGVLAQRLAATQADAVGGLVVGFGVNIGWAPPGAARVAEMCEVEPAVLLTSILDSFDALPEGRTAFADVYRRHLLTIGQQVRVHLPREETFDGLATGVDADGRIIIRSAGDVERVFDIGDVVHLRPGR